MSRLADLKVLATPKMTEAEAIRKIEDTPGLVYRRLGPESYSMAGPAGEFVWEGAALSDECFSTSHLGFTINITKAWRGILQAHGTVRPERFDLGPEIAAHLASIVTDPTVVSGVMPSRRKLPVLFTLGPEGELVLIDGAHRLKARLALGHKWAMGYCLHPDVARYCQVRTFRIVDGIRVPYSPPISQNSRPRYAPD